MKLYHVHDARENDVLAVMSKIELAFHDVTPPEDTSVEKFTGYIKSDSPAKSELFLKVFRNAPLLIAQPINHELIGGSENKGKGIEPVGKANEQFEFTEVHIISSNAQDNCCVDRTISNCSDSENKPVDQNIQSQSCKIYEVTSDKYVRNSNAADLQSGIHLQENLTNQSGNLTNQNDKGRMRSFESSEVKSKFEEKRLIFVSTRDRRVSSYSTASGGSADGDDETYVEADNDKIIDNHAD